MTNPKVFISHASEDKERFVSDFAKRLRNDGIDAWLDIWEMLPGDSLVKKIFSEGIEETQSFIAVISKHSIYKPWVNAELDAGVVKKIEGSTRLIPIVLDNVEVPTSLKSTLWIKIENLSNYNTEYNRILSSILRLSEKPPLGEMPRHATTVIDVIPGLTKIDSFIVKLAYENLIETAYPQISTKTIFQKLSSSDIPEEEFFDSLEILDSKDYIELIRTCGRKPNTFQPTWFGFEQYLKEYINDYDDIIRNICLNIINNNAKTNHDISKLSNKPIAIVDHVLDTLALRTLIRTSKTMSNIRIIEVSPELKRML